MLPRVLDRAYFALFREYPALLRLGTITGASQLAFALLSIYALPLYLLGDLKVTGEVAGAVSSTFLLCETILKAPLGRLSDRLGRRPFVVLGPLLICLNPLIIARLPARLWAVIFPIRALDGVGAAALWPPLFATVGDLVKSRSRTAAMSVMNTVYVGAIGAAAAVGSFTTHLFGTNHAPFYLASALLFVSAATAHFGMPRAMVSPSALAKEDAPTTVHEEQPPFCSLPLVLLVSVLMTLGVLMLAPFLIPYLQLQLHLPPLATGALLAIIAVPVLLLGLPLGHVSDRWGRSRAVCLSFAISAAMMWLVPFCRTFVAFAIVGVVLVLGHIMGTPAWLALVSDLAPSTRRGGVMGIVATAEGVGAVIAPLIGGWLWDMEPTRIFFGSAALLSLGAVIATCALRGKKDL